jgi:hypothetical protein
MGSDFFDPSPEEQQVVLVSTETVREAAELIEFWERCISDAEIPFDWILDRVTGNRGSETDYVLEMPAKCPKCRREIFEKTLVDPR